jgi:histidine triad (HIT) family protein
LDWILADDGSCSKGKLTMSNEISPFAAIINGELPGKIVVQDDSKQFALIEAMEPEAAVHWLAVPYEYGFGTEEMEQKHQQRFLDLVDFAITQTKALTADFPVLRNGFSVKFHVGSFETVPHAKLHILSTE